MNDELERIWKEIAMAYFSVLSWLLTEGTEEKLSVLQSVQ
jgi:hypothetical protein